MIANFNTMSKCFNECNKKYFNNSLPIPEFGTLNKLNTIARFEYRKNKGKNKARKPLEYKKIFFSDCYNFKKKDFIDIMAHEMIHYYISWNGIKDWRTHGRKFMEIANELNEKYGLNITKTKDASLFKLTKNAPKVTFKKKKSLFGFLFD